MSDKHKEGQTLGDGTAHGLASYYATLLCPYAITCKTVSGGALCIQNQSLALQLTLKQRPMPVGGRGQDSGSKAQTY